MSFFTATVEIWNLISTESVKQMHNLFSPHCLTLNQTKVFLFWGRYGLSQKITYIGNTGEDDDVTTFQDYNRLIQHTWVIQVHLWMYFKAASPTTCFLGWLRWQKQKKSAKSVFQWWTSTSLVHPLVQFPDAWKCHTQLFRNVFMLLETAWWCAGIIPFW